MELLHFVDYHGSNLSKRNVGDFAGYLQNCYFGLILQEVLLCSASISVGAQWLSGRVLDSRPKGSGFEPHRRHCVVVLEQDTFILA